MVPSRPGEVASKRLPVTPTMFEKVRDFSRGLGMSYDDTLEVLLQAVMKPGEDSIVAGKRVRDEMEKKKK